MRWILVVLVLLICSCGSTPLVPSATAPRSTEPGENTSPLPTEGPPLNREAEEYVVLSALIRQNPIGYDLGSFFVVREQTVFDGDMFESSVQDRSDVSAELADSYRSQNATPMALGPELDVEQDYVLMPNDEFEQVFGPKRPVVEMWDDFEERYPGASGVVFLSRVGFDASGDTALAIMGFRCPGLCGAGGLYLLVKEDGAWKVQSSLYEWMS